MLPPMLAPLTAAALAVIATWGTYVFGLFLVQSGRAAPVEDAPVRGGGLWTVYAVACLVIYAHPLASELLSQAGVAGRWRDAANVALLCAAFLLPALLLHLFLRIEAPHVAVPRVFAAAALLLDLACGGALLVWVAGALGRYGWSAEPHLEPATALTAAASTLIAALELWARRRDRSPALARPRSAYLALAAASGGAAALGLAPLPAPARAAVGVVAYALPILFVLAMAYLHPAAAMFDRLAKWGLFSLAALVALQLVRALLPGPAGAGAWGLPAAALPVVLLAPWVHGRISARIDRRWLGRPRSAPEAHRAFLAATGAAADEPELLRAAERCLAELFPASAGVPRAVRVELDPSAPGPARASPGAFAAPVVCEGRAVGTMRVEAPARDRPFLSEDRELFASLGEALGVALDNLRLRQGRAAQERREQGLLLLASRAELRALRAQIDPHFLFNALNAVAALIPRDPARAETVVEQLSEVFRYTLQRAGREWVPLDEELEFVRAYLDVEQARFGARLTVTWRAAGTAGAFVPAMVLAVLVENAVKHGLARARGPARLEVAVEGEEERVRMAVRDSGPGFPPGRWEEAPPGHGLHNTRERLRLHFGAAARLEACREGEPGTTVVAVTLPRVSAPPVEAGVAP